ncbi:hypothetical protein CEXT_164381 [Caerostris extrusa]|uniref:Uncharacterized protein n=1 Tax=Caerostris extrusa TaxID=172846 RepID=A0AAV4U312_CAEEX|nr:hypothetical protein CEXT_164381 [Caerostris extrusa]
MPKAMATHPIRVVVMTVKLCHSKFDWTPRSNRKCDTALTNPAETCPFEHFSSPRTPEITHFEDIACSCGLSLNGTTSGLSRVTHFHFLSPQKRVLLPLTSKRSVDLSSKIRDLNLAEPCNSPMPLNKTFTL